MATDTTVNNLIINKLTKAQYDAIANPSDTELYLVPDEIDNIPTSGSDNPVKSGGVYTALGNKQDTLVSGTNIKTVNNQSLLGSGNITIEGGVGTETDPVFTVSPAYGITSTDITAWNSAAIIDEDDGTGGIVSTNVELSDLTDINISNPSNGQTLVYNSTSSKWENGNASGGGGGDVNVIEGITMNGSALTPDANKVVDLGTVITAHQDISGKVDKSEMSVSTSGDQTTITLKSGTSATVINSHQSLSGKQDTLVSGTNIKTINGNSVLSSGNLSTFTPIVNHGTDDTTYAVTPNALHVWGEVASLTLTLTTPTDSSIVNEYMIQFESGSTPTTLSLPANLSWYGSAPSIEANKTYQISIINNVGIWGGV